MQSPINVICIESEAYYALIEEAVARISDKFQLPQKQWILGDEAMDLLGISSKTTLQKLRDTGSIRFSHPEKKIILYDRSSINDYLEKHSRDTF